MKRTDNMSLDFEKLKPRKLHPFEFAEKGRIVVLVQKDRNKLLDLFLPKRKKIDERIKLDFLGSFVWNNCDGEKTVEEIALKMKKEFGKYAEPAEKKVNEYIKLFQQKRLIDIS